MLAGVAALVALLAPGSAFANNYSWSLPGDFTGSNPEMKYGAPSWEYYQGAPGSLTPLTCTASGCSGGGDSVSVSGGNLVMSAASLFGSVTVQWTNPFATSKQVTITSSFTACSPTVTPNGTATVAAGGTVSLTISGGLLGCTATGTISITAAGTAPAVSVTNPTSNGVVTSLQQSYSGAASTGFGVSSAVTVRVFSGASDSGTPIETLSTTASGSSWSVSDSTVLADGQYTVRAEQDDVLGDQGLSTPVTFTVAHSPLSVSVTSPTQDQTVAGLPQSYSGGASDGAGISSTVTVRVYSGTSTAGSPIETLTTTESSGSWSAADSTVLKNGQYTVQAEQDDVAGDQSFSTPVTFTVAHPRLSVSVTSPTASQMVTSLQQSYSGDASDGAGISSTVTARVYSGTAASGTPIETLTTTESSGSWSAAGSTVLKDGQYTVQAEQDDVAGDQSFSTAVTFTVDHTPPSVSVTNPSSGSVTSLQQMYAGTASDGFGISTTVTVNVYQGTSASGTPYETLTTTESSGSWSVNGSTVLPDGQYTVRAEQDDEVGDPPGFSTPVTFTVDHLPPAVSVTSPTSGQTVTGAQQVYAGDASNGFGISTTVTVRVYSGSSASGTPVQVLTTTESSGSWSVTGSSALTNGQYTVQAEQDDTVGDQGFSTPITFTVSGPPPTVSLNSLGSAPQDTSTPTLSGTADTRSFDSNRISVLVYAGTNTTATPIRQLTTAANSQGGFSVQVSPALPDGQYTALAGQDSSDGTGSSQPVTFLVKAHPPALTLDQPGGGVTVNNVKPTFAGQAGDALGDLPVVTVDVYKGSGTGGKQVGQVTAAVNGSGWSTVWPHKLAYGAYTVVASQSDDAGHTSRTNQDTFRVAPTPKLIGSTLKLSRSGVATVTVGCQAGPGQRCSGTVLVISRHSYNSGGTVGPLEVLFAGVKIGGGQSETVHRFVSSRVLRMLLADKRLRVVVKVKLSRSGGSSQNATANRTLQLKR